MTFIYMQVVRKDDSRSRSMIHEFLSKCSSGGKQRHPAIIGVKYAQ
jgi:hypothetical protein